MKILAVSDQEISLIYSPQIAQRFHEIDLVIGCGDLPHYYLEFIISMLDVPLYFVCGNHTSQTEFGVNGERHFPWGAINLHGKTARDESGLLLAGIEGSLRYNFGDHQYTQAQMWNLAIWLAPRMMLNKIRYGRYLDILVTHAPPWKIHDMDDLPHRGIKAFNWINRVFKPMIHFHGHVHIYRSDTIKETLVGQTRVINAFGFRELTLAPEDLERLMIRPHLKSQKREIV